MSNSSGYTTPRQVKIKTYNNMSRIDSGNNPFPDRYENSYHEEDYKNFKQDYKKEKLNELYDNIFGDLKKPPSGQEVVAGLKKLEEQGKWGGLLKKKRSHRNKHKRTTCIKHTNRTRRNKSAKRTKRRRTSRK
jgi:hypothetical protein